MNEINFNIEDIEKIDFSMDVGIKEIYPPIENLEVTPSNEEQIFTHENSYGYDEVKVKAILLQDKELTINENGIHNIKADENYTGLNQVSVTVEAIENLSEELNTYNTELTSQEIAIEDIVQALKNKGVGEIPKYAPKYIIFREYTGTNLDEEMANLDVSNITNMSNMFYNCPSLSSLDLSNFNAKNVTTMSAMFSDCRSLRTLNMSGFVTEALITMSSMFKLCNNLSSLDLSSFNTENVTTMNALFYNCSRLISLNISSFSTDKVTTMNNMFYGCGVLSTLDVSRFNTENVTDMSGMFQNCGALTSLSINNFNTNKVTGLFNMFYGCQKLTSLDLSNWNTENVVNMSSMFYNCYALTSLDIRNFNFNKVTSYSNMFKGVPNDCLIIVKSDTEKTWITSKFTTLTNVKTVLEVE